MVYKDANTLIAANFNDSYFHLHDHVYINGMDVGSRNGSTKEILNFKTTLTNPGNRCIAGYRRNVNIFFLLAESLWIFNGRRDLEFLEIFNSGMKEFSEDGKFFHAPYGWRIRKFGVSSLQEITEESLKAVEQSKDQLKEVLNMLDTNPTDRRVVISVWNPEFDLNTISRDHPCNSMLMFKVRNHQLHQTIQNRSNDLNRGLTTNVFQFSFIGETMSAILGLEYATQTHNSQSLHLYTQHELTTPLQAEFMRGDYSLFQAQKLSDINFYDLFEALPIQFNFKQKYLSITEKLFWVDFYLHAIILKILNRSKAKSIIETVDEVVFEDELKEFCYNFWYTYKLLQIYTDYKTHKDHELAIAALMNLYTSIGSSRYDISVLSLNFFMRRIHDKDKNK